jgi:hypothetical protein
MARDDRRDDTQKRQMKKTSLKDRGLDTRSLEKIGGALKAHYEDLVRTPVPDKFLELLDQLQSKEHKSELGSGDDEST